MNASSPTIINGKEYDRYSLSLVISGSYDVEGQPEASVVMNLTPLRIESGQVDIQPSESKSICLGSLAHADEATLVCVGTIHNALQQFIAAKGI